MQVRRVFSKLHIRSSNPLSVTTYFGFRAFKKYTTKLWSCIPDQIFSALKNCSNLSQKSAYPTFMICNLYSKASEKHQNCSQITLLNVEIHFDTQIVFSDRTEQFLNAEKIWSGIPDHHLGVFGLFTNTWANTLGVQRSFWGSQEPLSSAKINLHIPKNHISMIVSQHNWYKMPKGAKKFEKVKNIGFSRIFRFSAMGKNRTFFAFGSWKNAHTMVYET